MQENFFARVASQYSRFRPRYPAELFAFLAAISPGRSLAWDCATGSGQAAQSLAHQFEQVVATDISDELLAQAAPQDGITYRNASALASGLPGGAVDLVTVANAMHWFHGDAFAAEVRRVLRPGGIIAAWSYACAEITAAIDRLTRRLHDEIVDPFWIEPNRIVERGYRDLHFPFEPVAAPPFEITGRFDLLQLEGYLRTWSACVKYQQRHGVDPVSLVHGELLQAWGEPSRPRQVRWQMHLRVGRV